MKKTRIASYLLAGKAASFPLSSTNSFADAATDFVLDMLTTKMTVLERSAPGIRVNSEHEAVTLSSDVIICNNPLPKTMNVVVTGAQQGQTLYLVASSDKDYSPYLALNSKLRIGINNQVFITVAQINNTPLPGDSGVITQATSAISIPVDLNKLAAAGLMNGDKFYLQAALFPTLSGPDMWNLATYSELDTIFVNNKSTSAYGACAN